MTLNLSPEFVQRVNQQLEFIARDKPMAAKKFKADLERRLKFISRFPYASRKSVYFDDELIRDCVLKAYKVVYRIRPESKEIDVFGFIRSELFR
jgi:plasmid stabilization system protein ParE